MNFEFETVKSHGSGNENGENIGEEEVEVAEIEEGGIEENEMEEQEIEEERQRFRNDDNDFWLDGQDMGGHNEMIGG